MQSGLVRKENLKQVQVDGFGIIKTRSRLGINLRIKPHRFQKPVRFFRSGYNSFLIHFFTVRRSALEFVIFDRLIFFVKWIVKGDIIIGIFVIVTNPRRIK